MLAKINELEYPYNKLAELRREQGGCPDTSSDYDTINSFLWRHTPEGNEFWASVNNFRYPEIPSDSIKELSSKPDKKLLLL